MKEIMRADAASISIHIHERRANGDNDGRKLVVDSLSSSKGNVVGNVN